jgi:pimeloyl-ACP methyl ester carboxylesterase
MMSMRQPTAGHIEIGDGTLFYQIAGAGETVVLSHAAFLDSRMFDALWELLTLHYRVIRYDMRGFGQSSAVKGPLCRRDDLAQLLAHLGVTHAHFIGCSNGGELMLDLALEQPSLVTSLTLVGSTPSGFQMQGEPPRYLFEMFAAAQAGDVARANELQIRIWFDGMFREPEQVDAALREKARLMNRIPVERQTFFVADVQPARPLDPPAVTRLHEVQVPVWVVVGALDHPEILRAADEMIAAMPNARKTILPDAGHVPSYEQPALFGSLLLDFLRTEARPTTP